MLSCENLSDLITGSSLAVLALVATSGRAMDKLNLGARRDELFGTSRLGMLGYVVMGWFVLKAYALYVQKCPSKMTNPMIEQVLVAGGLALGAYSLYVN